MVQWYWQRETEILGEENYGACVVDGWLIMVNGGIILREETDVMGENKYIAWVVGGCLCIGNGGMILTR
jgi:hypothetical protein